VIVVEAGLKQIPRVLREDLLSGNEPEKPVKATVRAEMADKSPQF